MNIPATDETWPLSFVRSGNVGRHYGSFRDLGLYGYTWASTAAAVYNTGETGSTSYNLLIGSTGTAPSDGPHSRWNAFSIRCLAY